MFAIDRDHAPLTALDAHEWLGVGQFANALSIFEPLAKRGNLGEVVANRLVSLGFAEKGPSSDRYFAIGMKIGGRLSELGWKVKDRSIPSPEALKPAYRKSGARLSTASFRKRGGKVFGGSFSRNSKMRSASAAEIVPRCWASSNSCCENVVTREQSRKQLCVKAP